VTIFPLLSHVIICPPCFAHLLSHVTIFLRLSHVTIFSKVIFDDKMHNVIAAARLDIRTVLVEGAAASAAAYEAEAGLDPFSAAAAAASHRWLFHLAPKSLWLSAKAERRAYEPREHQSERLLEASPTVAMVLAHANRAPQQEETNGSEHEEYVCLRFSRRSLAAHGIGVEFDTESDVNATTVLVKGGIPARAVLDTFEVTREAGGKFVAIEGADEEPEVLISDLHKDPGQLPAALGALGFHSNCFDGAGTTFRAETAQPTSKRGGGAGGAGGEGAPSLRKRIDDWLSSWWLSLSVASQSHLGSCLGALGLSLSSRLHAMLRNLRDGAPTAGAPTAGASAGGSLGHASAEQGCEWVDEALAKAFEESAPALPEFPHDQFELFELPEWTLPIPGLREWYWRRWEQVEQRRREHEYASQQRPRPQDPWASSLVAGVSGAGIVFGLALARRMWRLADGGWQHGRPAVRHSA